MQKLNNFMLRFFVGETEKKPFYIPLLLISGAYMGPKKIVKSTIKQLMVGMYTLIVKKRV